MPEISLALRDARALIQDQVSKLAKLPRATWAHLEAGSANPTLSVLHRVASALQVPLDDLIATPKAACAFDLACEAGRIVLTAAGEGWELAAGDVVVFRGDQRHAYANPGGTTAVGYSVVLLAPVS